MVTLLIEYQVPDFDEWKEVFDRDPLGRRRHGATGHTIDRDARDRNHFLLGITFPTARAAVAFRDQPAFQQVWEMSGAGHSWITEPVDTATYDEEHR